MPNEMRSEFMKNAMPEPILLKHNSNVPVIRLIVAIGIIKTTIIDKSSCL